jgi:hypothetical protein
MVMRRFAATIKNNKNPLEIFGNDLKLYIDATDTSSIDFTGNDIDQINDLSGNNNHLIYSGSGFAKPTGNIDSNQTHSVELAGLNSLKIADISDFRTQEGEFIFYILDAATCLKVGALETYSNPQFSCHFRYHHEVDISATSSPGVGRA